MGGGVLALDLSAIHKWFALIERFSLLFFFIPVRNSENLSNITAFGVLFFRFSVIGESAAAPASNANFRDNIWWS